MTEKRFVWLVIGAVVLNIVFWGALFYVLAHFVLKFW
jgi:hypothetical protein